MPPPISVLPDVEEVAARGGAGEGECHRKLKKAIAQHPEWLGLPGRLAPGQLEVLLCSGDRVDVVFEDESQRVAVEVKAGDAAPAEIVRGLFQCVKYGAVPEAEAKAWQKLTSTASMLALGGGLPLEMVPVRSVLNVPVHQCLDGRLATSAST
jgi:hypothetical protein